MVAETISIEANACSCELSTLSYIAQELSKNPLSRDMTAHEEAADRRDDCERGRRRGEFI